MTTDHERLAHLQAKLADANRLLALAEDGLEQAVAHLQPVLVGDKQLATEALQSSFLKLSGARQVVTELEQLIATELAGRSS